MASNSNAFITVAGRGLKKGWEGFVWMLKILLPVSFLTFLIESLGWFS